MKRLDLLNNYMIFKTEFYHKVISKESAKLLYFPNMTGLSKETDIGINYMPFNRDVYTSWKSVAFDVIKRLFHSFVL